MAQMIIHDWHPTKSYSEEVLRYVRPGTNVRQRARAEWEGFWMMRLPPLVFCAQIEGARVLEVRWENHGLIPGLTG